MSSLRRCWLPVYTAVSYTHLEVTKEYSKGVAALNGINLKIEQGEFVFIVGDSGSGKSTLIRLIMKELDPTSGTIIVNGHNLNRMKHKKIPLYLSLIHI